MEKTKFSTPLEEMSRGMQQKISIARALVIDPPLFFWTSPQRGWIRRAAVTCSRFLKTYVNGTDTTILLTTHDMAEAERLCARIGFLAHGKLVAEGTADELKEAGRR